MNRSRSRLPGCAVAVAAAAAAAVVALCVCMIASCATFGDTTTRELDAKGLRTTVREWTGVSLPESLTVVRASRTDAFMDPSMSAVFDASDSGVADFVATLGERLIRSFSADCSDPAKAPAFTEVVGSVKVEGAAPSSGSRIDGSGGTSDYQIDRAVESGEFDRCKSVVTVFARPTSPYVDMAIQKRDDGTSRVVLAVTYT